MKVILAAVAAALALATAAVAVPPRPALSNAPAAPAPGPIGPEGVPIPNGPDLAPPGSPRFGQAVDGIKCERTERVLFHIHAHLTIFVGGKPRRVPLGIGIAPPRRGQNTDLGPFVTGGSCFSWLHTHASDGVLHIESPVRRTFTLGNFFDIWRQPLGPNRVGPARGHVEAFLNGHPFRGNPRNVPLRRLAQIQLDVGSPAIAPGSITFPQGLL